jgi:hypothetical protein
VSHRSDRDEPYYIKKAEPYRTSDLAGKATENSSPATLVFVQAMSKRWGWQALNQQIILDFPGQKDVYVLQYAASIHEDIWVYVQERRNSPVPFVKIGLSVPEKVEPKLDEPARIGLLPEISRASPDLGRFSSPPSADLPLKLGDTVGLESVCRPIGLSYSQPQAFVSSPVDS